MNPWHLGLAGDVHGHHHALVAALSALERSRDLRFAAVLQVGDFEPCRDADDLASMPLRRSQRRLGDFAAYASGSRHFPWPLSVISGNHEPRRPFAMIPDGGQLASNCRYLGRVACLELRGLRVVAVGGGWDERADRSDPTRFGPADVAAASAFGHAHLLLLHDWPAGLLDPDQVEALRRQRGELDPERLGNPGAAELVERLRPRLVVCGHLHLPLRAPLRGGSELLALAPADRPGGVAALSVQDDRLEILSL